jgi:hypothetical protein
MKNHVGSLLAKNVCGISLIEVEAISNNIRLPSRAFVSNEPRMIFMLGWNTQRFDTVKVPSDILAVYKLPSCFMRKLGMSACVLFG